MQTKEAKHIAEHTIYIDKKQLVKAEVNGDRQIFVKVESGGHIWNGALQKIYNDEKGEAYGYDVYIY